MNMPRLRGFAIAIALMWQALILDADASPKRVALLLGNADYNGNHQFDAGKQAPYLTDLVHPCADTRLLRRQLSRLQFEITEHCDLNRDTFKQHVDAFADSIRRLPSESIVFVYYSGHGSQQFGSIYWLPTMFALPTDLQHKPDRTRSAYFQDNAINIKHLVTLLPQRKDVAVVFALDNCRDAIAPASPTYDEKVTPLMPANFLTQYATTPGDTTIDNGKYAQILAEELASGDSIDKVIGRVTSRLYEMAGNDDSKYPYVVPGPAFYGMRFLHRLDRQIAVRMPQSESSRTKGISQTDQTSELRSMVSLQGDNGRTRLDIFWCAGDGGDKRQATAIAVGQRIASGAQDLGVGRIRVRVLTEEKNSQRGYRIYRNIVRYDRDDVSERKLLARVAAAFPDVGFLPSPGWGTNRGPTGGYVSAFVCADSTSLASAGSGVPVSTID